MQMPRVVLAPMALAAVLCCAPAFAGTKVVIGDTTNSSSFNRAIADHDTGEITGLSGIGTDVKFDTFSFSVSAEGAYTFTSIALGGWDNYLFLYQGTLDPSNALTGALIGNDDFHRSTKVSRLTFDLQTNTVYTLVTTGFENSDFGRYLNTFKGAGEINAPVPEPGPAAMLLAGLAALGFVARRRAA